MARVTILLARHGESDWNVERRFQGHADRPLTEQGRTQAQALADDLGDIAITAVYSSDLERAAETARIVAAARSLAPTALVALREVHVGELTGMTYDEVRSRWPDAQEHVAALEYSTYGGESFAELQTRVTRAIDEIALAHPNQTVLVVGHGAMIRAFLAGRAGVDLEAHRTSLGPIGNATINEVHIDVDDPIAIDPEPRHDDCDDAATG